MLEKYSQFCQKFFQDSKTTWFEKKGVKKLDELKNVEFTLVSQGTFGQYEGFTVRVVSKEIGELTSHFFAFNAYLTKKPTSRDDINPGFKIIDHCFKPNENGWYITEPTEASVKEMVKQMNVFAELYRDAKKKTTKTKVH